MVEQLFDMQNVHSHCILFKLSIHNEKKEGRTKFFDVWFSEL